MSPGKLQPKALTRFLEKPLELSHYLLINTSWAEILVDGMAVCMLALERQRKHTHIYVHTYLRPLLL